MFSKTAINAILLLKYLSAQDPRHILPARELAPATGAAVETTLKVLKLLVRDGLVMAHVGCMGGYRLAAPPEEITLLRVVEAVEGRVGRQKADANGDPQILNAVRSVEHDAATHLRAFLSQRTIAGLGPDEAARFAA